MENKVFEGGCLCRETRYRFSGKPLARANCHCRECRLAAGAASVAWVVVPTEGFGYVASSPASYVSSPGVTREFCPRCGTTLTYQHESSTTTIDIATATLDEPEAFPPEREVWASEKVAWETLDPSLPHFARLSKGAEPIN